MPIAIRTLYSHSLVAHASALPVGRGWSPLEWQIANGASNITVSLIAADDEIDAGPIFAQETFAVHRHELRTEIEEKLYAAELRLMNRAMAASPPLEFRPQEGAPTHYRRRTPDDSRLDPTRSISDQFDILRIADATRFPAFFELHGQKYHLIIKRAEDNRE